MKRSTGHRVISLIFIFLFTIGLVSAGSEGGDKKFNAGDLIMHHITDSYEWHIATLAEGTSNEKHNTLFLPMILYKEGKGLKVFSSSNFYDPVTHQPVEYAGFTLDHGHLATVDGSGFYDLSITKHVLALLISLFIICILFISIANRYKRNANEPPKGLQSLLEPLIIFIRDDIAKASIGPKYEKFVPFLLSVFFFIWITNLLGLLPIFPGGANVTGDVAVTMVLALFTFVITTFSGNKHYWLHIFNTPGVPWWLKFPVPLMPIVEFIGVLSKPFVLMVRLFANITAGHIIILGFFSLIFIFGEMSTGLGLGVSVFSVAFSIFMYTLELLVAFLQAYVFTLLSAIYFGLATEEHHHEEEHHEVAQPVAEPSVI